MINSALIKKIYVQGNAYTTFILYLLGLFYKKNQKNIKKQTNLKTSLSLHALRRTTTINEIKTFLFLGEKKGPHKIFFRQNAD